MTLTIDFTPQEEAWITAQALLQGMPPAELIKKMVEDRMPEAVEGSAKPTVEIDDKSKAAIALCVDAP